MRFSQGTMGRVFVLRLEDGDRVPDCLERFAAEQDLEAAACLLLGGAAGGKLVVGPVDGEVTPIVPMLEAIAGVHEIAAVGTLFPDAQGRPRLHMHGTVGRGRDVRTGCVRQGVDVWRIAEVVLLEILGTGMRRVLDPAFGFEVLATAE